jgi:hypothetical protein
LPSVGAEAVDERDREQKRQHDDEPAENDEEGEQDRAEAPPVTDPVLCDATKHDQRERSQHERAKEDGQQKRGHSATNEAATLRNVERDVELLHDPVHAGGCRPQRPRDAERKNRSALLACHLRNHLAKDVRGVLGKRLAHQVHDRLVDMRDRKIGNERHHENHRGKNG